MLLCASLVEAAEPTKQPLIIAIADDYPPFSIVTPTGEPAGFLVELWREWSAATDTPIQFRPSAWAESVAAVRDGRADIHSGLFKSAERAAWMAFSEPIYELKTGLYFKSGGRQPVPLAELAGARVGTLAGSFQEQYIRDNYPDISIVPLRDSEVMTLSLLSGDIDALVQEGPVSEASLGRLGLTGALVRGSDAVLQNLVHAGVRKQDSELLGRINKGLWSIAEATLAGIENRWLPRSEDHFYSGTSDDVELTPEEEAWLSANPSIRLAVTNFITPVDIVSREGTYSGLNADLIALLNAKLSINIVPEFHDSWSEVVRRTLAGEVDGALSLSRTPEREREIRFTKPYAFDPIVVVVQEDSSDISTWDDLEAKSVTVVKGFAETDSIVDILGGGTLIEVEQEAEGLRMVSAGEADAHVSSLILFGNSQRTIPVYGLKVSVMRNSESGALRIGIHNSKPQLFSIIRKGLNSIDREELAAIRNHWLITNPAESAANLSLTEEELVWLREHRKIRVHNETAWPPFNYAEDGQPKGFSVEFMNLLAKQLGIEVEYVTGPTWGEFLGMIRAKELDVMLNIIKTPEREKYIAFTKPYVENPPVIVARVESRRIRGLTNLYGRTVAIPDGFFYQEVIERKHPQIELKLYDNQAEALTAVSLGEADATLGGVAVQTYLIRQHLLTNLNIAGAIKDEAFINRLRIGVRDDWPLLQSILQKSIDSISGAEIEGLKKQWLARMEAAAPQIEAAESTSLSDLILLLGIITAALVLLLIGLVWGLRRLKKRNAENMFQSRQVRVIGMVVVAVFLGALVSAAWVALDRMERQVRNEMGSALTAVLQTTHEALRIWEDHHSGVIREIAGDPQFVNLTERLLRVPRNKAGLIASGELAGVRRYFAGLRRDNGNARFGIIASDQVGIASLRNNDIAVPNIISIERGEFLARAFGGETVLVPPVHSDVKPGDGQEETAAMFFATPVNDRFGDTIAVLTLRVDVAEDFTRIMRLGRLGETGETYAFDADAHLISDSRFDGILRHIGLIDTAQKALLNLNIRDPGGNLIDGHALPSDPELLPHTRMAAAALKGESGLDVEGYRDYRGVSVFGAWLWDSELKIGLATEVDEVEAMSSYESLRNTIIILLGAAILLGLGLTALSLWMGQSATRALARARDKLEFRVEKRTHELQHSETRIRAIIDNAIDGIIVIGSNGIVQSFSPAAEKIFGYSAEEVIGENVNILMPKSDSDEHDGNIGRYLGGGDARVVGITREVFGLRKDGTTFPMDLSVGEAELDDERVFTGIIRDITARKQAEETVRKSEEEMRTIYETAATGISLTNLEGKMVRTNRALQRMLGRSEDEIKSVTFEQITHPDDVDNDLTEFAQVLSGESDGYQFDKRFVQPDGSIVSVSMNVATLKNSDGETDGVIVTCPPITVPRIFRYSKNMWRCGDGEEAIFR